MPAAYPEPVEGDFSLRDFSFASGEKLSHLSQHYRTIGKPAIDRSGAIGNAVLLLHGTGGSGQAFLTEEFAGHLFGPGRALDAEKYFIVLPDAIGTGQSSKPSDGLRGRFPAYRYTDMVQAQHALLETGLGIGHLRLVLGTSMGGMHTWMWGTRYPRFMDALMPMASLPVAIAGRNRMMRRMIMDSIRSDPDWLDGEYDAQPRGLRSAIHTLLFMISCPLQWQQQAPTRELADSFFDELVEGYWSTVDANDLLYQIAASADYDPQPALKNIEADLVAINSADDQVNPPELGVMEVQMPRVRHGQYVLIPTSKDSFGHRSYGIARLWAQHLTALLARTGT